MQKTIIRPKSDAALLRVVPDLIGMQPADSVVFVVFDGNRSCGALRVDLPPEHGEQERRTWLTTVMGMLLKVDGADGVMPVVYTSAPYRGDGMREAELLRQVLQRAELAGIVVKRLFCVAADGYAQMQADRLPKQPRPLSRIGVVVAPAAPMPATPDTDAQEAFDERIASWLLDEHHAAVHGAGADGRLPLPSAALEGAPIDQVVEAMLEDHDGEHTRGDGQGPTAPCDCRALFAALVGLPATRDVVMLQIAWGPRFGRHAARRLLGRTRPVLDEQEPVVQAIEGGDMARPDITRIRRGVELAMTVAGHSAPEVRAPALAVAAWLSWAGGQGTRAGTYVEEALRLEPDYSFANLLSALMEYRMLPEWAYRALPFDERAKRWARPGQ